ncbi:exopolysaccharide biosynthesis protein [Pararhizobium sp.]|uniref:exopolysaccharide biosynthesis protein n=1 Tax=Pararhizobium sp. TaxID=1977563 RepID=UPI00272443CF|nr:exopolysaccharide biosynthesis protein [Pararhizobium sp.]MDO9418721.1 exopolysaccharide biosynthesis protein [Pararhizobium sp.]
MTDFAITDLNAEPAVEKQRPRHLSELLRDLALAAGPKITVNEIAEAMKDRSFGAFLVVFALPNLIPLPPGATVILGLPLVFIAWQMMTSRSTTIWLPARIGNHAFETASFALIVTRITPWLKRAETLVKPRFWFIRNRLAERLLGFLALVLATVVFLPIPFGNWLPAFSLAIIGFALTERDGASLLAGIVIALGSLVVAAAVVAAAGTLLTLII